MTELTVTRLLQNPLGQIAPVGARGDIVRVSDGVATIYLDPAEFAKLSEGAVRAMLRGGAPPEPAANSPAPAASRGPRSSASWPARDPGSVTDPRHARRRAQPLW